MNGCNCTCGCSRCRTETPTPTKELPGKDAEFEDYLNQSTSDHEVKAFARRLFYGFHYARLFSPAIATQGARVRSVQRLSVLEPSDSALDEGERLVNNFKTEHPDRLRPYRSCSRCRAKTPPPTPRKPLSNEELPGIDEVFESALQEHIASNQLVAQDAAEFAISARSRFYARHYDRLFEKTATDAAARSSEPFYRSRRGAQRLISMENEERAFSFVSGFQAEFPERMAAYYKLDNGH